MAAILSRGRWVKNILDLLHHVTKIEQGSCNKNSNGHVCISFGNKAVIVDMNWVILQVEKLLHK